MTESLRPVRCLVVCSDAGLAADVEGAIEQAHGIVVAGTIDPLRALAGLRPACDVLLVADQPTVRSLGIVRELNGSAAPPPVLLLAREPGAGVVRDAMAVGARGVLGLPPDPEQLGMTARAIAWPGRQGMSERGAGGRVIGVCGAKGGVGTTLIALASAVVLRAMLIDLGPGGDLAGHLGCPGDRSLADLARLGNGLTVDAVAAVAVSHPLGVRVLPGVSSPDLAALLPAGLAPALTRECRVAGGWTVADLGIAAGSATTAAVVCADDVLVVTTPDRLAVGAAAQLVTRLVGLGVPDRAIGILVNRWSGRAEMSPKEIERATGARVAGVVRFDERFGSEFANDARITVRRRGAWPDIKRIGHRLESA
jgi:pilus assembly protein CpaE